MKTNLQELFKWGRGNPTWFADNLQLEVIPAFYIRKPDALWGTLGTADLSLKFFFHPSPFANFSPPDLFFQHLCLFQIKMEGGSEDDCVHSKLCVYLDWKLSFTLLFSHGNAEDLGLIIRCSEAACCLNHNWMNFHNLCKTSWIGGFRILERTDKTHFVPRVYSLLPLHGTCSWWLDVA